MYLTCEVNNFIQHILVKMRKYLRANMQHISWAKFVHVNLSESIDEGFRETFPAPTLMEWILTGK